MILAVLPNLVQAFFAAAGDYYTWQLAERMYGTGSKVSKAAVRILPILWVSMDTNCPYAALDDSLQPVAMVLFHKNVFKLS